MSATISTLNVWHVACTSCAWATEVYRRQDADEAKQKHDAEFHRNERCGDRVPGTVPSWAGEDQISPCRCVRPAGHGGSCECAHEAPADMVPVHTDGSTP